VGWFGFLVLHVKAGGNLLFSPRRETSNLSENSRKLSFASTRVVAQVRNLAQTSIVLPKQESLA